MNRKKSWLFYAGIIVIGLIGTAVIWRLSAMDQARRMPAVGKILRIDAHPEKGFLWPYYIFIPESAQQIGEKGELIYLLVFPNNTGEPSDDLNVHDQAARNKIDQNADIPARLGTPMLIPVFPRPWEVKLERDLYVHALDRRTLETDIPELERVDLQLLAMIDDAAAQLRERGWEVNERVLMMGFSASGMFANRFTVLHPDRVLAAAIGSPGGWPVAPVAAWEGNALNYPLGVSDLKEITGQDFDLETYRGIRQLYYIGDQDDNDAVDRENRPYLDRLFGSTPVERWPHAEQIYTSVSADAQFILEMGVGHTISSEAWRRQIEFFSNAIAADRDSAVHP